MFQLADKDVSVAGTFVDLAASERSASIGATGAGTPFVRCVGIVAHVRAPERKVLDRSAVQSALHTSTMTLRAGLGAVPSLSSVGAPSPARKVIVEV